eukprot:CAMPEP_0114286960 /NCGR_PEP_ID=MMETSP0059-20121206/6026_1 /TAXON_ID=36894 /ORGANISM="Pyramimonas parkeae, Strain CCMP726" /LENGTH=251 /DNA_ID=CAMNT_0001408015 /DNA_START=109 /DNA_END=861 /DNA_ORIENTATION=-
MSSCFKNAAQRFLMVATFWVVPFCALTRAQQDHQIADTKHTTRRHSPVHGQGCSVNDVEAKEFERIGKMHGTDKVSLHQYQYIYPRFLNRFRRSVAPVRMLEIGYFEGSSMKLWRQYLPKAHISAMDIKDIPPEQLVPHITYHRADQTSPDANKAICEADGPFDIIIDDGAHTMVSIRTSLQVLLSCVKKGGYFIVEDLHTAYWERYGGGHKSPETVMNIFKDMMDVVNRRHFNSSYSVIPGDDRVTGVFC